MKLVKNAEKLARIAHDGQFRKYKNLPYIVHPEQVYLKVKDYSEKKNLKDKELLQAAAWLHDVLEDCPHITKEQIIEATNEDVYNLVVELTNPSKGSKASRAERKKMDRDHLKTVSLNAKIIKICDRILNLKDMKETCPDTNFLKLYASESRLLYDALGEVDIELQKELIEIIEEITLAA